jgi:nicotinamidase-related amidase
VSPKRAYGAFDGTGLDEQLQALGVDEVVIVGQHTTSACATPRTGRSSAAIAVTVPRDGVCCFHGFDAEAALEYLVMAYGASLTSVAELMAAPVCEL